MRQYAAIKKDHPSALLFFRLGDFYELFFDDAVLAANELQITLTSRNKEKGIAIPMCGVPHHAAEGYISKLIRKGFKVAICEQVEDPRLAKKLVRREVTRVVTPGTAADSSLSSEENNFLAAVAADWRARGICRARPFHRRISRHRIPRRGRGQENSGRNPAIASEGSSVRLFGPAIRRRRCRRHHSPAQTSRCVVARRLRSTTGSSLPTTPFRCWKIILECCRWKALAWRAKPAAAAAAGAILYYVRSTQRGTLRPCRPHWILRAADLPGARCGHGAQSRTDRTAVRRRRCRRHAVSLDRRHRHSHGQTPAALLAAAAVDRSKLRSTRGWMPSSLR